MSLCVLLVAAGLAAAPVIATSQTAPPPLLITPSFDERATVLPDSEIELRLNRPLQSSEGTLAVFLDTTDVTSLFTFTSTALRYSPTLLPLPLDAGAVTVYLVSAQNAWQVLGTFPVRVAASTTTETASVDAPGQPSVSLAASLTRPRLQFTPSLSLGLRAQPAESHSPDTIPPPRSTFTDVTMQSSLKADVSGQSGGFHAGLDLVGSSFRGEALRFGQKGADAPKVDPTSYITRLQTGLATFALGHLQFGTNRLLIDNLQSRGLTATVRVGPRADVTVTALNGTTIVGWDNFTGIEEHRHRSLSGVLGVELLPRAGALRFELTTADGSLLPITSFNRGSITDAEESRGGGLRITTTDKTQRFRLDGGFARSRFNNPADSLLSGGFELVPVREVVRNAHYLDLTYALVQNASLRQRPVRLVADYRHQRAAPLFRTVMSQVIADTLQNQVGVSGSVGELTANLFYLLSNNNVANISSVLTSLTQRHGLNLGMPVASIRHPNTQPSVWWPTVTYILDWTHQYADAVPENGGFELSAGSVPDQVSSNQLASVDWQGGRWRAGYRFNRSYQDNRQLGRERADFVNLIHVVTVGLTPTAQFDLNTEIGLERAENMEQSRLDRTLRLGCSANWRMTTRATLTAIVSAFGAGDVANTSESRSAETNLRWSYLLGSVGNQLHNVQGQLFVTYANRYSRAADQAFGFHSLTKSQILNVGLTLTLF